MRHILAALFVLLTPWTAFFLSGHGVLVARAVTTTEAAEGSVTCHYLDALGTRAFTEFTRTPTAVNCPGWQPVRWPGRTPAPREGHWAAAIPSDRPVTVVCRFVRRPTDNSELSQRFSADAPLRLRLHLAAGSAEIVEGKDRAALGEGVPHLPLSPRILWLTFQQGELFGGNNARLVLILTPLGGQARLILNAGNPQRLWVREGGCRPASTPA